MENADESSPCMADISDTESHVLLEYSKPPNARSLHVELLRSHYWVLLWAINITVALYNTYLLFIFARGPSTFGSISTSATTKDLLNSPASLAMSYSIQQVQTIGTSSKYFGTPSPEVDEAWSELLNSTMIIISEDEIRRMGKNSVSLLNGEGYVGYLETFHMLHCVKRLYQTQYPEYYPDLESIHAFSSSHFDHCLEVLRQGVMCKAEPKVNTFYWKTPDQIGANTTGSRQCADWHQFKSWADSRRPHFGGAGKEAFMKEVVPGSPTETEPGVY